MDKWCPKWYNMVQYDINCKGTLCLGQAPRGEPVEIRVPPDVR